MLGLGASIWTPTRGEALRASALIGSATRGVAIDFRDMSMIIRDTATPANNFVGLATSKLSYVGASNKYVFNRNGLREPGTGLRTEYNFSGQPIGLRAEAAATNLQVRSNAYSSAAFITAGATATDNAVTSINGLTDASTLIETVANSVHSVAGNPATFAVTAGASLAQSVPIKAAGRTRVQVYTYGPSAYTCRANFLLSGAGSVTSVLAGSAAIQAAANGWYLLSLFGTVPNTGAAYSYIALMDDAGNVVYIGDGVSGVHVGDMQVEVGAAVTSPIRTAATSVTRASDLDKIKLAQSAFPWAAGAGTLAIDGVSTSPTTSGTDLLIVPRSGQTHIQSYLWLPS